MTDKDYSLLRPFDLEAAKGGAKIVAIVDSGTEMEPREFVAGPDKMGYYVVTSEDGDYRLGKAHEYRLAPLCWIGGKPVYPDTPMERADNGWPVSWSDYGNDWQDKVGNWASGIGFKIQWPRPKPVKRWINVYPETYGDVVTRLHSSKESADTIAARARIACIEIELPPLPAERGGKS